MGYLRSPAFHIYRFDYSETSQIATFFTREHGKMTAIAKGSRRPKNSYDGPIDLLVRSDITWIPRPPDRLNILTHCDQTDTLRSLRTDPRVLKYGFWMVFIMNRLNAPGKPNRALFDLSVRFTEALPGSEDPARLCVCFDLFALRSLGHLPVLDRCTRCETPVPDIETVLFSGSRGGTICRECAREPDAGTGSSSPPARRERRGGRMISPSPGTLRALSALLDRDEPLRDADHIHLSPAQRTQARRILNHYYRYIIGYDPQILSTL